MLHSIAQPCHFCRGEPAGNGAAAPFTEPQAPRLAAIGAIRRGDLLDDTAGQLEDHARMAIAGALILGGVALSQQRK